MSLTKRHRYIQGSLNRTLAVALHVSLASLEWSCSYRKETRDQYNQRDQTSTEEYPELEVEVITWLFRFVLLLEREKSFSENDDCYKRFSLKSFDLEYICLGRGITRRTFSTLTDRRLKVYFFFLHIYFDTQAHEDASSKYDRVHWRVQVTNAETTKGEHKTQRVIAFDI